MTFCVKITKVWIKPRFNKHFDITKKEKFWPAQRVEIQKICFKKTLEFLCIFSPFLNHSLLSVFGWILYFYNCHFNQVTSNYRGKTCTLFFSVKLKKQISAFRFHKNRFCIMQAETICIPLLLFKKSIYIYVSI